MPDAQNQTDDLPAASEKLKSLKIEGNVVPHQWYKTIQRESGKPHLQAILILAEIVYWYRPTVIRDEDDPDTVRYETKFKRDKLQRSYQSLADQFGLSKQQAKRAVRFLEDEGLLAREVREIKSDRTGRTYHNALFIDLNVEEVARRTYPEKQQPMGGGVTDDPTCTETTNTETSGTENTDVRVCAREGEGGDTLPAAPSKIAATPSKSPHPKQSSTKRAAPPTPTNSIHPHSALQTSLGPAPAAGLEADSSENTSAESDHPLTAAGTATQNRPNGSSQPSGPAPQTSDPSATGARSEPTRESEPADESEPAGEGDPSVFTEEGHLTPESLAVLRQISRGEKSEADIKAHPPDKNWAVAMYEKYIGTSVNPQQQDEIRQVVDDPTRWAEAIKVAAVNEWKSPDYSINKVKQYYQNSATSQTGRLAPAGDETPTSGNTARE